MMTSDDTQLLGKNTQVENPQNEQTAPVAEETSEKQSATWKKVAIGGTSGILLGAGASMPSTRWLARPRPTPPIPLRLPPRLLAAPWRQWRTT